MKRFIPAVFIAVIGITIAYFMIDKPQVLKVYNPIDINSDLVDKSMRNVDKFHRVGSFNLTNQDLVSSKTRTRRMKKNTPRLRPCVMTFR